MRKEEVVDDYGNRESLEIFERTFFLLHFMWLDSRTFQCWDSDGKGELLLVA